MPRPTRCRRVCAEPECRGFAPLEANPSETVLLTVDEYETIRLVDYEKRTHEQCAAQMEISRTTVTEIYERARFKLADSLVNGKPLHISGGHYRICQGGRTRGCGQNCPWVRKKGETTMRIAVPYDNGQVFQHFGHTSQMKLYDIQDGQIVQAQLADTTGSGHGALAGFLSDRDVDVLICGGIGGGAQTALAQAGIRLCGGVTGGADDAVRAFLTGTLDYDPDAHCDHQGREHHGQCGQDRHGCAGSGGDCGA